MDKPTFKVENGVISVTANLGYDGDKDTKNSVTGSVSLEIDAYELITEVAKKDIPFLEAIIKQVKA